MLDALKALLVGVLTREPALVVGVVVAVVGAVFAAVGIVVPEATVGQVVAYVVAVLTAALVTRSQVTPASQVVLKAPEKQYKLTLHND